MKIIGLVSVDEDYTLGHEGKIPWPTRHGDTMLFEELTKGCCVVIGAKRFLNPPIMDGKFLAVLTNDPVFYRSPWADFESEQVKTKFFNGEDVLGQIKEEVEASRFDKEKIFINGGNSIYNQFGEECDEFIVSVVNGVYTGDCWFNEKLLDKYQKEERIKRTRHYTTYRFYNE